MNANSSAAWRNLALQFDMHRMQLRSHLHAVLSNYEAHVDIARQFLSAPLPVECHPSTKDKRDAARYQWLFGARTQQQAMDVNHTVYAPLVQDMVLSELQGFFMCKEDVDTLVDTHMLQEVSNANTVKETYKQELNSTNCMQCCVAYMLGLPLSEVPHFAAFGEEWEAALEGFVQSQGYALVMLPSNYEVEADYFASGTTTRGTTHMVVMNDGKLVHDPHPSNAGLDKIQCVWILAKSAHSR